MSDAPTREQVTRTDARNLSTRISPRECLAMRELDADDGYTRSEIAFMFECKVRTVAVHCDGACDHQQWTGVSNGRQYSDNDLLTAYRLVYERQPYPAMSSGCYDAYRPAEFPASSTIQDRFDSWRAARERARGDSND